jgi:hypothetical protein
MRTLLWTHECQEGCALTAEAGEPSPHAAAVSLADLRVVSLAELLAVTSAELQAVR